MSRFLEQLQAASGDSAKTIDACITIIDYIYVKCTYPRLGKRAFNNHLTHKSLLNAINDNFDNFVCEENNNNNREGKEQEEKEEKSTSAPSTDKVIETVASTLALITSQNPHGAEIFTSKAMIDTIVEKAFPLARSSVAVEDLASFLCNLTSNNREMKKAVCYMMPDDERAQHFINTLVGSFTFASSPHAIARLANLFCNLILNFPRGAGESIDHHQQQFTSLSNGMFEKLFSENVELIVQLFSGFSRVTGDEENDDCIYWLCILLTLLLNNPNTKRTVTTCILSSASPEFWKYTFVKAAMTISTAESVDKLCSVLVAILGDSNPDCLIARQILCGSSTTQPEYARGTRDMLSFMMKYASRTAEATEWFSFVVFYLCLENPGVFYSADDCSSSEKENNEEEEKKLAVTWNFVERFEKELGETAKQNERCRRIHKDALDLLNGENELEYRLKRKE